MRDLLLKTTAGLKVGQSDNWDVFVSAVIDEKAYNRHVQYIEEARADPSCEIVQGGTYDNSKGWFVDPTIIVTTDTNSTTMREEIFGPVLTVYVYDDSKPSAWEDICAVADETSPFGLTGSIYSTDRTALNAACDILRHAAGNLYLNDKSTGAVVGEQPFGGARASGTNDKAGSHLNLLKWVSARTIKENTVPLRTHSYPYLGMR